MKIVTAKLSDYICDILNCAESLFGNSLKILFCNSSGMPFIISVSIKPGATAFTLIPYFASSFASVCVIAFTAPFVAL